MKKIDLSKKQKNNPHFIGSWNLENDNLCEEMISFFEKNKELQTKGFTSKGFNDKIKKRSDITIKPNDLNDLKFLCFKNFMDELNKCYVNYYEQWPAIQKNLKNVDISSFNIGKYLPGDHFSYTHSERESLDTLHRSFAWMTYLNNVDDGGETYFNHFDLKIKPEIGKTLIWPADWTHIHSGEILKSGVKYIITGWMHFPIN